MKNTWERRAAKVLFVGVYAALTIAVGVAIIRPAGTTATAETPPASASSEVYGAHRETAPVVEDDFPVVEADAEPVLVLLEHIEETAVDTPETALEDAQEPQPAPVESEYPVAAQVVQRLRAAGWSDVPIAGVLGNMMAEVGGQTLDLKADTRIIDVDGRLHYGLCGWSLYYCPEVDGRDVDGQMDYLLETVGHNMRQFGGGLETYLDIEDVQWAALYFSLYYERNAPDCTGQRALNAEAALKWMQEELQ